jgi:hypothetical protein
MIEFHEEEMDPNADPKTTTKHPITRTVSLVVGLVVVAMGFTGRVVIVSSVPNFLGVKPAAPLAITTSNELFDKHWTEIQEVLCPAEVPNTALGPTLFAMAGAELGISSERINSLKQQQFDSQDPTSTKTLTYQFYHGRFANAAIYINGNHTIAYIPIWKAANNAIRQWMKTLGTLQYVRPERLFGASLNDMKPSCVVTAVRDPISHFLSGYNEIEYRKDSISNNTLLPSYYNMPFDSQDQRQDRFAQFVRDIVEGESRALLHLPFSHVFSMSRVLEALSRNGGVWSGYLPSIANLSTEFPTFFKNTCKLEEDLPAMKDTRWQHKSSHDPEGFYQSAKTVWAEGGEVARALCMLHAMDYACWKNLPDGIPKICKDIYSSPAFITSIAPSAP